MVLRAASGRKCRPFRLNPEVVAQSAPRAQSRTCRIRTTRPQGHQIAALPQFFSGRSVPRQDVSGLPGLCRERLKLLCLDIGLSPSDGGCRPSAARGCGHAAEPAGARDHPKEGPLQGDESPAPDAGRSLDAAGQTLESLAGIIDGYIDPNNTVADVPQPRRVTRMTSLNIDSVVLSVREWLDAGPAVVSVGVSAP